MTSNALNLDTKQRYTYDDYLNWNIDARYELVNGVPYAMAPSPSRTHQTLHREIFTKLANFLDVKPCEVFSAPFDVRLKHGGKRNDTVLQPDIVIICDKSKLDEKGVKGAPDMVIEILSKVSVRMDRVIKFQLYQKAGVREYWVPDPERKTVDVYILRDGEYFAACYSDTDPVPVGVLEGYVIYLTEIFGELT